MVCMLSVYDKTCKINASKKECQTGQKAATQGVAVWQAGAPRQESNLYLPLRRGPFYPLNYGDNRAQIGKASQGAAHDPG